MTEANAQLHFFLGANTPQGFVSRYDQIIDPARGGRCFVLKGGPGCGKSTLIRNFAAELEVRGLHPEYFHCSSDLASLDAAADPALRFAVLDGTPPHAVEPRFPGAFEELLPLGECWDGEALRARREDIMELFDENRRLHELCRRYLASAGLLLAEAWHIAAAYVSTEKLAGYARRFAQREFGGRAKQPGRERVRFLSAVTDRGIYCFNSTARALCERLYVIEDEYGAVSRPLLASLRKSALEAGHDVVTCCCTMFPYEKIEHLFIPSLGLGFTTSNKRHPAPGGRFRTIHARRFTDTTGLASKKIRLGFTMRAASELLREAACCMAEAKGVHNELEGAYSANMDYEAVSVYGQRLLEALRREGPEK